MFYRYLLPAVFMSVASCGAAPNGESTASEKVVIQGELTENSYRDAVTKTLAQAKAAISDPTLKEERLDKNLVQLETLIGLESRLNVDKSELSDAELMSTLGAMYARKAGFHSDNANQAGTLAATGFRYLDRAVSKYPNNLTARINRGLTCAKLPDFMNKAEVARDDLLLVVKSPEFARLTPELQGHVKSVLQAVEGRALRSEATRN